MKKDNGTVTLFVYDEAGNLLGEYDAAGSPIREHVWFQGAPVAVMAGADVHYVHTDHLGTPRAITDAATVIWRWESDPFGSTAAQEDPDGDLVDFTYNLRFPGQYYDSESGLHYNYLRTYDPRTGTYLESDPIGLDGGLNTYGYVGANPLQFTDPTGEFRVCARKAFRGVEGQYEWMFWFEFTGSCLVEKIPSPFKWLNRGRRAANLLPDHYAGENDVPKSELCRCRDIDPMLKDYFEDQGYRSSSSALGARQFTREGAERVLQDLRKEFERLVDEDCSAGDDCSALRNAYPWERLLDLA